MLDASALWIMNNLCFALHKNHYAVKTSLIANFQSTSTGKTQSVEPLLQPIVLVSNTVIPHSSL